MASSTMVIRIVLALLMLAAVVSSLQSSEVKADLTDSPTSWLNFVWVPYLHNGNPVYDSESSADPSNGGTGVEPDNIDIASGAASGLGPGTEPSVLFAYYDGGTPGDAAYADDFYSFRLRMNANPEFKDGYGSRHWDVIIDIDCDGYKEFVIDLAGEFSQNDTDRLFVFYNDLQQQTYDPANDKVAEFVAASTNQCPPNCPAQNYNHTRVVIPATGGSDPDEVWLDLQIPITALKNKLGVQQVYPSALLRLFYSTSASNTDPLQKDWMLTPFSFGDPLNPNVEATIADALFNDADGSGSYTPGDTILYTVLITNDGNLDATGVTFSDIPDVNTSLVVGNVTTTQGVVTSGNSGGDTTVTVNVGTVPRGGGNVTITFKVTIDSPFPLGVNQVSNQGTVSGTNIQDEPTDDPVTAGDDDSTVTLVDTSADLAVNKIVDNPTPNEGEPITYAVTVTNNGPNMASSIVITDALSEDLTYVSSNPSQGNYNSGTGFWAVGDLAKADSATLNIVANVNSGTSGLTIPNIASITSVDQADPTPANNSDSADIAVTAGQPPYQPSNSSPADDATCVSVTATLLSSAFSDPDLGDTHAASQWQITTTSADYSGSVFDSGHDLSNLTSIVIPAGELNYYSTYYWHVRYQDNSGTWSSYSVETSFATCNTPTGSDVTVSSNGTSVTFSEVSASGCTNVTESSVNPAGPLPPFCCVLGYFVDITTTATYTTPPPVTVGLAYDESGIPDESSVRLYHWNQTEWEDVTTSLDTANNVVYGQVSTLSPFIVGYTCGADGGTVPAFPNIYIGIAAALGGGLVAYFLRRRFQQQS